MNCIGRFEHAAIFCRDLAAQVAWYNDVFNGTVVLAHEGENAFVKIAGGILLELIQTAPGNVVALQPANANGLRHLAFTVDDLERAKAHLAQKNVPLTGGWENKADRCATVFFEDPEGNLLQFMYREVPLL